MLIKNFLEELFNGNIIYDDLSELNEDLAYEDQIFCFKEDLLQIEHKDRQYLLDVGWRPEFNLKGFFKIVVIKNDDWQNPLYEKRAANISDLKTILQECKILYGF